MPKVQIIEREMGWAPRLLREIEFETDAEAEAFAREYNNEFNPQKDKTPGVYIYAHVVGQGIAMLR